MKVAGSIWRWVAAATLAAVCTLTSAATVPAFAQANPPRRTCLPISERAGRDAGCWLLASEPLGAVSKPAVYWHLDTYATRAEAEAAKGPRGTVIEAHHPGPEAWYTMAGEMCVETPAGKMVGRTGDTNIIPADTPVTILATGTEQRRSVWLVLHESAHPWTAPVSSWTPKDASAVMT